MNAVTNQHSAEWLKAMADMETEGAMRTPDAAIEHAERIHQIRGEVAYQRSRAQQLRADLYASEARIGELRGEFERLTGEVLP